MVRAAKRSPPSSTADTWLTPPSLRSKETGTGQHFTWLPTAYRELATPDPPARVWQGLLIGSGGRNVLALADPRLADHPHHKA
jgi:hypothetical protein